MQSKSQSSDHRMIYYGEPKDTHVQKALGILNVRHGQLEYSLRMVVRSIENLSIKEALKKTERKGPKWLRERIEKKAKERFGDGEVFNQLIEILERSRAVSEKRNGWVHNLWANESNGDEVVMNDDLTWSKIPTAEQLTQLSNEISSIANELNVVRLEGFLFEALTVTKEPILA